MNGLLLALGVIVYFAAVHARGEWLRRIPLAKEFAVGTLFTLGTFLAPVSNSPAAAGEVGLPALAFLGVCLANLAAIDVGEGKGQARQWTEPRQVAVLCSLGVLVVAIAGLALPAGPRAWFGAVGSSASGIFLILQIGDGLPLELRRVLIDASLLTPLLYLR
jgi:hypothetical protein